MKNAIILLLICNIFHGCASKPQIPNNAVNINKIEIKYLENDPENGNYPSISATLPENYNAWVQIVDTNAPWENGKWRHFVDYDPDFTKYPIYTNEKIFYDAPRWNLDAGENLNWLAKTFPVKVENDKIIAVGAGFSWGFIANGNDVKMTKPKGAKAIAEFKGVKLGVKPDCTKIDCKNKVLR